MISAFEVAQFVSDEQSWRELADTRKFPLPPEFEPECELDARPPNPFVLEPTLILVEFDQIVGQNILLTCPTLTTSAINQLNDSLQVVFGVNYQDVAAMSQFCILPESSSVFPDIEYPTYARYFTVYDVDGRGLVRNCCICFLASTAHQLYKYLDCMETQLTCLLSRLTEDNLGLFWRALHLRLRNLEYTRDLVVNYHQSPGELPVAQQLHQQQHQQLQNQQEPPPPPPVELETAHEQAIAEADDARTLRLTDCDSVDSGIAGIRAAIQVVRDYAAASADPSGSGSCLCLEEVQLLADSPPTVVKIMSIHASDSKREMKPIWQLLGQERDSLTGLMADAIKQAVKSSEDDAWAWCLPSLLEEVLEQLLAGSSGGSGRSATSLAAAAASGGGGGGDRGLVVGGAHFFVRPRVGSMASSIGGGGGGGGAASVDSFKSIGSLRSYRDDASSAAAAAAAAGLTVPAGNGQYTAAAAAEEFHSVGSSNSSSLERIYTRECSWTLTSASGGSGGGGVVVEASLPIHESLRLAPPVFPNVTADPTAVFRFVSAYSQYPYGVAQAVHCLLHGRRLALLCRTEDEARLLQQALALFVPFADSNCSGPWFSKLPVLSALAKVPIACVRRAPNGQLPSSASLQRFLCCLDVGARLYAGPVYQGGALLPLFGSDVGQCMLRSQEFAVRFLDLILTELAQLTLTVMSLHLLKYQQQQQASSGSGSSSSIGLDTTKTGRASTASPMNSFESQRQLTAELARFGISQDDYLIGMHLSKLILGRLTPGASLAGSGPPPQSLSLS